MTDRKTEPCQWVHKVIRDMARDIWRHQFTPASGFANYKSGWDALIPECWEYGRDEFWRPYTWNHT